MHIFITGGAGFIGSHIAESLLISGHRVTILDDLSSGVRGNVPNHPLVTLIEKDLLSYAATRRVSRHAEGVNTLLDHSG